MLLGSNKNPITDCKLDDTIDMLWYHYYCGELDMIQLKGESLVYEISLVFERHVNSN